MCAECDLTVFAMLS